MRAVEEMGCVMLCHLAQRTVRTRIFEGHNMVKLGRKDGGFVSPELCKSLRVFLGSSVSVLSISGRGLLEIRLSGTISRCC